MIFFGKGQCNNCHDGTALNSEEFFALGVADFQKGTDVIISKEEDFLSAKKGRGVLTKKEEDLYKFETPQLHSMKKMGFYGYGG
ncbi:MAG: cytochrome c peroxidase [Maribacter sp.]|jgi:cytochrome c peroxidase